MCRRVVLRDTGPFPLLNADSLLAMLKHLIRWHMWEGE